MDDTVVKIEADRLVEVMDWFLNNLELTDAERADFIAQREREKNKSMPANYTTSPILEINIGKLAKVTGQQRMLFKLTFAV